MRYAIAAVAVVAALLAAMLWMPNKFGDDGTNPSASNSKRFQPLEEISRPDYNTVVTDNALRAELKVEAQEYIESLTADASEVIDNSANSATGLNSTANVQTTSNDFSEFGTSLGDFAQKGGIKLHSANSVIDINGEKITVKEFLQRQGKEVQAGGIYYVHNVAETDVQGVWGVIQSSLIQRFGDGVAQKREEDAAKYAVLIPEHADERLPSGKSSFLGQVIYHKVFDSEVFTKSIGLMKNDKDIINPADDIVVVMFKPSELISVYQYFATRGQSGALE